MTDPTQAFSPDPDPQARTSPDRPDPLRQNIPNPLFFLLTFFSSLSRPYLPLAQLSLSPPFVSCVAASDFDRHRPVIVVELQSSLFSLIIAPNFKPSPRFFFLISSLEFRLPPCREVVTDLGSCLRLSPATANRVLAGLLRHAVSQPPLPRVDIVASVTATASEATAALASPVLSISLFSSFINSIY